MYIPLVRRKKKFLKAGSFLNASVLKAGSTVVCIFDARIRAWKLFAPLKWLFEVSVCDRSSSGMHTLSHGLSASISVYVCIIIRSHPIVLRADPLPAVIGAALSSVSCMRIVMRFLAVQLSCDRHIESPLHGTLSSDSLPSLLRCGTWICRMLL